MQKIASFKHIVIYAYSIDDGHHDGMLKVGKAEADVLAGSEPEPNSAVLQEGAHERIKAETLTAGIAYKLEHVELAYFELDGVKMSFIDKDVHTVLRNSGYEPVKFGNLNGSPEEWFRVDLETVRKAIAAVKANKVSLDPQDHRVVERKVSAEIVFRKEQEEAITGTINRFKVGNRMLWNAKMRFGKTLCALEVIRRNKYRRTLIITHRPAVRSGWFEDFNLLDFSNNYYFGHKKVKIPSLPADATEEQKQAFEIANNRLRSYKVLEQNAKIDGPEDWNYIFFASIQDLAGSMIAGGKFDKNEDIFSTPWDLIIIDEAHEGTTTERGEAVVEILQKNSGAKTLYLSGTPYNILDRFDGDEIFFWTYELEQAAKQRWQLEHPDEPNPYGDLPKLCLMTYNIQDMFDMERDEENDYFNFAEFFRVDRRESAESQTPKFVHEGDVIKFLDLLCLDDETTNYPFSTEFYRSQLSHTLWVVPGVAEAEALAALIRRHPTLKEYHVLNVAGDGDDSLENPESVDEMKKLIAAHPNTITITCGRHTTGVSVPDWSAVLMLCGGSTTSAAFYLQTIFRAQTPTKRNVFPKKEVCYAFDFAPDRTIEVVKDYVEQNNRARNKSNTMPKISLENAVADTLHFLPVIAQTGSEEVEYNAISFMTAVGKAYSDHIVRRGFRDRRLFIPLDKLSNDQINGIINIGLKMQTSGHTLTDSGSSSGSVTISKNDLVGDKVKNGKKTAAGIGANPDNSNTPSPLNKDKKKKSAQKKKIFTVLCNIYTRLPMLIFGLDFGSDISIDYILKNVDRESWDTFMPKGIGPKEFKELQDLGILREDVFTSSAKAIIDRVRAADLLPIEERVADIAAQIANFHFPDKETVLTPWRVVNMHMSDTLGGYTFYNEEFTETISEPRYVEHHKVTDEVFAPGSHLLEINSKSGLYPLYLAYNLYRRAVKDEMFSPQTLEDHLRIWDSVVAESLFVVCKTPMAKAITRRTLMGFRKGTVNMWAPEDLINKIKNQPELFIKKVHDLVGKNVKINAIVGNPPYQVMDGGGTGSSAVPLYNLFVDASKRISPSVISMIMPAKWYSGGRGLDTFREEMLNDTHISKLIDFQDSRDCFPTVDIAGGICYFLWQKNYDGECLVVNKQGNNISQSKRYLNTFDTFIRNDKTINIIQKVQSQTHSFVDRKVYSRKPFGLRSFDKGFPAEPGRNISLFGSDGISYLSEGEVPQNSHLIPKWKIIMSKASAEHAGQTDKDGRKRIVSRLEILPPGTICTESYLLLDVFDSEIEATNMKSYMRTQFVRFLLGAILLTQNIVRDKFRFVPLQDFTENSDIDWTQSVADIDRQLYKKYGLTDDEIAFIESMIKPM